MKKGGNENGTVILGILAYLLMVAFFGVAL